MPSMIFHDFYCLNCGKKSLTLPRKTSRLKEKFHRKKLYCTHCKVTINHIECRNDAEIWEFKENWAAGVYKTEAEQSKEFCTKGAIFA